ncbi:MAG: RNA recognition motif domain-containing protein [Gammaproteobacteria bacterium]
MNIYVGNLAYSVKHADLRAAFEKYGTVDEAEVVIDRRSNRSRGYGFVRMSDDAQARGAIAALNGSELAGRKIRVDESKPKGENEPRRQDRPPAGRRGREAGAAPTGKSAAAAAKPAPTPQPAPAAAPAQGGVLGFFKRLFGG